MAKYFPWDEIYYSCDPANFHGGKLAILTCSRCKWTGVITVLNVDYGD